MADRPSELDDDEITDLNKRLGSGFVRWIIFFYCQQETKLDDILMRYLYLIA